MRTLRTLRSARRLVAVLFILLAAGAPARSLSPSDTPQELPVPTSSSQERIGASIQPTEPQTMSTIREEVHKLADQLPADANWDDAMYALYVRMKVAEGEHDIAEGRVLDQEEVERRTAKWLAV